MQNPRLEIVESLVVEPARISVRARELSPHLTLDATQWPPVQRTSDRDSKKAVAVLGAGHGGLALAASLSLGGFRVNLWNRSVERIAPIRERGGIRLTSPGWPARFAPIGLATCRAGAALEEADRVVVAIPASGHADVARASAPYLRDHHAVLLLPGRTGGALEFLSALREAGCRSRILLGESNTFPFASRCTAPASATIYGTKTELLAAALSAQRTPELLSVFRSLFPMLNPAQSVLHTGLANVGALLHPTIALMNADRILSGVPFDFYTDGVTPEVAEVLAEADAERLRIARAFDVPACSLQEWIASAYGHRADSILAAVGGNPAYVGIKGPTTLSHRYLLEDVPTGLIPLLELGRAAGVVAPTLNKLIDFARTALGDQQWSEPRTLTSLGLDGLAPSKIRDLVENETPEYAVAVAPSSWVSYTAKPCPGLHVAGCGFTEFRT